MKLALKIIAGILAFLLLVVGGYVAYVFLAYHRIADEQSLSVTQAAQGVAPVGQEQTLLSWNIGFAAYSDDFSFFMDGGTESWAFSKEAVYENLDGILSHANAAAPDFLYFQEVDLDSTRSYHVDEGAYLLAGLVGTYSSVCAVNYDSPFLFYPLLQPHGASRSGIFTLSRYGIADSTRYSLPVESGFRKLLDLDRCYSVTRVPVENGKELCLFNLHLSAYTADGTIATEQLQLVLRAMQREYDAGNYVICGGDFNKDLPGNSSEIFGISGEAYTWAQPLERDLIPDAFQLVVPLDPEHPVATCRNTDKPYDPATCFVVTVDGFLVSDNVQVNGADAIDTGFAYTDHNPVLLSFTLLD